MAMTGAQGAFLLLLFWFLFLSLLLQPCWKKFAFPEFPC